MANHAKWFGASSSAKWLNCAASVQREAGIPNTSSTDADYGTCAHELAAICLNGNRQPSEFLGQKLNDAPDVEVDQEMVELVTSYVEFVRHLVETTNGVLFVETLVDYRRWLPEGTGDDDGFGTADAIIITDDELIVVDLKAGAGVKVEAEGNTQMRLYALGAYAAHGELFDFEQVRMIIHQPRKGGASEWVQKLHELLDFGITVHACADQIVNAMDLGLDLDGTPGEKQCQWCRAKATCPDLQQQVLDTVFGDFDNLDEAEPRLVPVVDLPAVWRKRDMIAGFLRAVEERMLDETRAGNIPGYKLVEGRRGNRAWTDAAEVERMLKGMRVKADDMYVKKLIGVPDAEKLLKDKPRAWNSLKVLVTQPAGKETVAPIDDPRPAVSRPVDDFETL